MSSVWFGSQNPRHLTDLWVSTLLMAVEQIGVSLRSCESVILVNLADGLFCPKQKVGTVVGNFKGGWVGVGTGGE